MRASESQEQLAENWCTCCAGNNHLSQLLAGSRLSCRLGHLLLEQALQLLLGLHQLLLHLAGMSPLAVQVCVCSPVGINKIVSQSLRTMLFAYNAATTALRVDVWSGLQQHT